MDLLTRMSISKTTFFAMFFVAVITVSVMAGLWISHDIRIARQQMAEFEQDHLRQKKNRVKNRVQETIDLINYHRTLLKNDQSVFEVHSSLAQPGSSPIGQNDAGFREAVEKTLQNQLLEQIQAIRPGQDEYLFIIDYQGLFLMHPVQPDLAGKNIRDATYTDGEAFVRQMTRAVANPDGDYITYLWKKPSTGKVVRKLSFLRPVPQWQWVIGSGIYLDDIEAETSLKQVGLVKQLEEQRMTIFLISVTLMAVIFLIARTISFYAHKSFEQFTEFFSRAAVADEQMKTGNLYFKEFDKLANHANQMIDERRELHSALRESEKRFRTLLDTAPSIAVQGFDRDMTVNYWNRGSELLYGYARAEAVGKTLPELILPGNMIPAMEAEMATGIETGIMPNTPEMLLRHCNGTRVPVLSSRAVVRQAGSDPVFYCLDMDLSAIKQAEKERGALQEQLAGAKKMEALGLLAGGVAHDLNNILSGLVSYPEVLLLNPSLDQDTRNGLETIRSSGEKAAAVVRELITLTRGVAATMAPLSLNEEIQAYLSAPEHEALRKQYPDVSIYLDLAPDLHIVSGSAVHVGKSLMNLIYNSVEAVSGRSSGTVEIITANTVAAMPQEGAEPGAFAVVSVKDNGPGISTKDIERIFEPFYTKKVMGKSGTGLGLAVVWNIMQNHGGFVSVSSCPEGTCFDLFFPATTDTLPDRNPWQTDLDSLQGNGKTVLVVDDEAPLREVAMVMLQKLGYAPTAVTGGQEAIDFIRRQAVDVVLLDMIMEPGLNGRETYEAIIAIEPDQKAIIASGYTRSSDVEATMALGAKAFIEKPYTLLSLGSALKHVVEPTREPVAS